MSSIEEVGKGKTVKEIAKEIVVWLCGLDVSADITEGVMRTISDKIASALEAERSRCRSVTEERNTEIKRAREAESKVAALEEKLKEAEANVLTATEARTLWGDRIEKLESILSQAAEILKFIVDHCGKDYTREIERPEFNAMMESLWIRAKEALKRLKP